MIPVASTGQDTQEKTPAYWSIKQYCYTIKPRDIPKQAIKASLSHRVLQYPVTSQNRRSKLHDARICSGKYIAFGVGETSRFVRS